jgi:hypothetical protein
MMRGAIKMSNDFKRQRTEIRAALLALNKKGPEAQDKSARCVEPVVIRQPKLIAIGD